MYGLVYYDYQHMTVNMYLVFMTILSDGMLCVFWNKLLGIEGLWGNDRLSITCLSTLVTSLRLVYQPNNDTSWGGGLFLPYWQEKEVAKSKEAIHIRVN